MMKTAGCGTGLGGRRRGWILDALLMSGLGLSGAARTLAAGDGEPKPDPGYREVPALNAGLAPAGVPRLDTPQSVLDALEAAARSRDGDRGARCLNLNALDASRQAREGPRLAMQLVEVLDQLAWRGWDALPDRPDGQEDLPAGVPLAKDQAEPRPRSNILVQRVNVDGHGAEIRVERVKPPGTDPVWVVAERTVAHIPDLHRAYGPTAVQRLLPSALSRIGVLGAPAWLWVALAATAAAGLVVARLLHPALIRVLARPADGRVDRAVRRLRTPGGLVLGLLAFAMLPRRAVGLCPSLLLRSSPLLSLLVTGVAVWFLIEVLSLAGGLLEEAGRRLDPERGARMLTRLAVARNVLSFAAVTGGVFYALGQFDWFSQMGMGLLASAGIAGLVVGIAGQRVLGNLFAGMLLAATEPVRAGDAILFEESFGWIEEVALTYLVIRSWDLRRIVVPISYFLDKPFQNWSRKSSQLMMPVYVFTDYRVDVDALREEFRKILESSPDWDRSFQPILQVTGCSNGVLELRGLCGAGSPTASWNLQCLVRERLVAYLRQLDGGAYLPRTRIQVVGPHSAALGAGGEPPPPAEPAHIPRPSEAPPTGPTELQGDGQPEGRGHPEARGPAAVDADQGRGPVDADGARSDADGGGQPGPHSHGAAAHQAVADR